MAQRGASVEFRHVTKRYGRDGVAAVDGLSFTVSAGEICALVGPSGGGKTTALKMVNRLIEPTSGQILIDGRDVTSSDRVTLRRRIGYVIQQVGLFPHQTVADNVATVPRLLGWERPRIERRIDELLALVGLDPGRYRARYPAQLSGGERQRVGVARALAAEPPLMLMDEPFAAVDPIVRERLQDEFLRIHHVLGTTVIFVTHDIDEAIKLGDKVALLRAGRLVQYAPPADLLSAPADDFVARFVGADRGLKRLSLVSVGELELRKVPTAREGESISADRNGYVLLLDNAAQPTGWVNVERVRGQDVFRKDMADPSSPLLSPDTRVRDALSQLLSSAVRTGLVVDERGRYVGVLSLDDIVKLMERLGEDTRPAARPSARA